MGIELPPELADVAAATGLSWPQADEDKLREQASAWRAAHEKLTALAADADSTAGAATDALTGPSGDAARKMWSEFVHPDHGKLTLAARGAGEAADRLTHAADQVGAAKVEMVRQLVDAAKNKDAAHSAASAGHPTALLGLDTVLRGTAANLTSLTHGLAGAVGPGGGGGPVELLDPNPGTHSPHGQGGLLSAVTGVPAHLLAPAPDDGPSFEDRPLLRPVHDVAGGVPGVASGAVHGLADGVRPVADAVPGLADGAVPGLADGAVPGVGEVARPVPDVAPPAIPDAPPPEQVADLGTGPIQTGHYGGLLAPGGFEDIPTPPAGIPHMPGGTVASGFADGTYTPPPLVQPGYGPPAVAPVPPQPAGGGSFPVAGPVPVAPGAVPPVAGPPPVAPIRPAPAAAPPVAGVPAAPAGPPPGAAGPRPGAPASPQPGAAASPRPAVPASPPPGAASLRAGAAASPRPAAQQPPLAHPDATPRTGLPANPRPGSEAPQYPPLGAPRQERETVVALFRVHMFPIGHLPVATVRPARQLPVPPSELDYAAGLRFPPHDHPRSELIDSTDALEKVRGGFSRLPSPPQPPPPALTEGYDPLGGLHERDWDRRFLAGMRGDVPEYAWPPGELYPEGGHEPGEPDLLPEGTLLDRFGGVHGRVFAPDGTLYVKRSLPPATASAEYRRYRVLRDLPMWTAVSAPWFGQPGGGVRYRAVYSADELVTMGYLALEEGE
jgi:hypothetical protein